MLVLGTKAAIVAGALGVWQFAPGLIADESLIGRPSEIAQRMVTWTQGGVLPREGLATLAVVFYGLLLGGGAGFALGILTSLVRPVERLLEPAVGAFSAMPKSALVPLFILWFGIGLKQQVIFTALVVFFFFFFATLNGIKSVSKPLNDMLAVAGASRWQRFTILYLPSSLTWLLAGARLGIPHAFTAAITAEVVASRDGLGHLVKTSASLFDAAGVFSAVAVVVLMSVSLNLALNLLGSRLRRPI